ncbi:MAG: lysophospholipid acyltransferase family protein [Sphingomonadaceae bacterium]
MSGAVRRFGAMRAATGLVHGLMLVPGWLLAAKHSPSARVYERQFMQRLARRLVADNILTGASPEGPGTLYISNHISWMDIPLIGSALDADFIAKSDVRRWPVIGPLSRRSGTLFITREERHRVHHQADEIGRRLKSGRSLVLFAEGTTSDGLSILPFRSSLFEAAAHAVRIQPIAVGYHRGDGALLSDEDMRRIGWTGDEELLANLGQVSRLWLKAEIRLAQPFAPEPGMSRKALAQRCHDAVREAYAAIRNPEKRSE